MATLILKKSPNGTAQREEIQLDGNQIILGRSPDDAQIIIPSQAVSRMHAQITVNAGNFYIEDLKSRNGTTVNNKPVTSPTQLRNEDKIKICDFLFVFADETNTGSSFDVKPELPPAMRKKPADDIPDEVNTTSTIEATLARMSHKELLDTQPTDRLRALLEVTTLLAKQVKVDDLLNQVADVLFGLFKQADRCFVILTEDGGKALIPKVTKTRRPGTGGDRFSKTIVRKCLESGQCFISEDASGDSNLAPSASIAEFRIKSVVCAPMLTPDGRALGVIQVDGDRSKKFGQDDMKLLGAVAVQAAATLENVRLHENVMSREKERREVEIASQVQRGFLPQVFPVVANYDFYAHYVAAQTIGGDYYDFIPLSTGQLAVILGDVSGKSVPAALLMAKLSAEARFCTLVHPTNLAQAVNYLNEQLVNANLGDRYVTLCATMLDPVNHTVTMVNAGHEMPFIYRAATHSLEAAIPEDLSSFPLCWVPGNEYPSHRFELNPGDALIIFTDGINDARNIDDEAFGRDRIGDLILGGDDVLGDGPLTPQKIGERIISAVQKHSAGRSQFDDIALVVYGRTEGQPSVTGTNLQAAP